MSIMNYSTQDDKSHYLFLIPIFIILYNNKKSTYFV